MRSSLKTIGLATGAVAVGAIGVVLLASSSERRCTEPRWR